MKESPLLKKVIRIRDTGESGIRWALVGLGILLFAFLAVCGLLFTGYYPRDPYAETVYYRWQNPLLGLGIMLLFAVLLCLLYRLCQRVRLNPDVVHNIGLVLIVLAGILWVLIFRSVVYGEPINLKHCAYYFMDGIYFPFTPGEYLHLFPHQLAFISLMQGVYTLFGRDNDMVLYLINVACLAAVYTLSVRITRRMFKREFTAFISVLLLLGCLYLVVFTTFIYAILLGLALSLLAVLCVYRFWDTRHPAMLVLGAAAQALAVLFKSNYAIFAVGLGLVLLVDFIKKPSKAIPIAITLFLVFSFGFKASLHGYYQSRAGMEFDKGVPSIVWVAMAVDDSSYMAPGWFNGDSYYLYETYDFDREATSEAAKEKISNSLSKMWEEGTMAAFFFEKTVSQWNEPTMGCFLPSYQPPDPNTRSLLGNSLFYGKANDLLLFIMDKVHLLVYTGALLCFILKCKKLTVRQALPFVILLGGFLFHSFLWEGKSQYIASYFVLAVPYAAEGWALAAQWLSDKVLPLLKRKRKKVA